MSDEKSKGAYDDIIDLAYPFQLKHPRMNLNNRAAQFSAFKALTGYHEAISETAKQTEKRIDLDTETTEILNIKLRIIHENVSEKPLITITYFLPDDKNNGAYLTVSECIKKIDEYENTIVTTTGLMISIDDIYDLKGDLFKNYENIDG